jgi:hypothetical protein
VHGDGKTLVAFQGVVARELPDPGERIGFAVKSLRMGFGRLMVLPAAARLRLAIEHARRSERRLLAALGADLCTDPDQPSASKAVTTTSATDPTTADIHRLRAEVAKLDGFAAASLNEDRADYATVPSWAKGLVIARGLLARRVSREKARRIERELLPLYLALGSSLVAQQQESIPRDDLVRAATVSPTPSGGARGPADRAP